MFGAKVVETLTPDHTDEWSIDMTTDNLSPNDENSILQTRVSMMQMQLDNLIGDVICLLWPIQNRFGVLVTEGADG